MLLFFLRLVLSKFLPVFSRCNGEVFFASPKTEKDMKDFLGHPKFRKSGRKSPKHVRLVR